MLCLSEFKSSLHLVQEAAYKIKTLREVEALLQKRLSGPKGDVSNANAAVVEQHLKPEPYTTQQLEGKLGTPLKELFAGNSSQLRVLEIAESAGKFDSSSQNHKTSNAPGLHALQVQDG